MPGDPSASGQPSENDGDPASKLPGWEETAEGSGDGDWETSNEIPGPEGQAGIPGPEGEAGTPGADGDDELDAALEDFDGEILAEREVIRERSNENAGSSTLPEPYETPGSGGKPSSEESGSEQGSDSPMPGGAGVPRGRTVPPAPVAGAGSAPDDLPDAKDDDIVARQLREAAMNETDPELREKLWDEYRRYKGA